MAKSNGGTDRSRSRSRSRSSHRHRSSHRQRRSSRSRSRSRRRNSSHKRSPSPATPGSTVLEACWKPVRLDPTNFDAWTHLLQCVENLDDLKAAKDAFDPFLAKFPYCFGYWRKYAELYRKHQRPETALEVYERGVAAVPLSVDLWLGYLSFVKEHFKDVSDEKSRIERLYDKAIEAAGLEFRSDKLWEDYVNWRIASEDYVGAMKVYDKFIRVPLLLYSAHFDKLQEFVNSYEPHEVLSAEEFDKLYKDIEQKLQEKGHEIFVADDSEVESENVCKQDSTDAVHRKKYSDEALKLFRIAILDKRRKVHLKTENEVSKRWNYEEAIKRPYFHVKPLERAQLKNWRHYLDFEIDQGDKKRIKVLFERCLVACAMYEDIWIRYARYAETVETDDARQVYKRACEIHLPHKANMHLIWAAFEEKHNNYDFAKAIVNKFEAEHGSSVLLQTRRLGADIRRAVREARASDQESQQPDFSMVCKKFESTIAEAPSNKVASFYAIKYARFHNKIRKDYKFAEKILLDATTRDPTNAQLHLHLAQMAYERQPFRLDHVLDALDRALDSPDLSEMDKLQFSQRKLELLEDLGDDVDQIQRHYESHVKLYKNLGFTSGKKRPTPVAPKIEEKRFRTDASATAGVASSLPPTAVIIPPAAAPPALAAGYTGAPLLATATGAAADPSSAYYGYYYSAAAQPQSLLAYGATAPAFGATQSSTYGYYVPAAAAAVATTAASQQQHQ